MLTLMGIIALHYLVILISKNSEGREPPYITTIFISLLLSGYVFYMLVNMPKPVP